MKNLAIGFVGVALPLAFAAPSWAQAAATNAPSATTPSLVSLNAVAGRVARRLDHRHGLGPSSPGASSRIMCWSTGIKAPCALHGGL
jgi:hypothetical protein